LFWRFPRRGDLPLIATGCACWHHQLRRGYATRLIEAAEEFALDKECRGIYVDTPVDNEVARAFYLARGYSEDYRMSRY
jgi:GNAT superfamily N-acetyltransferase